ncbi:MAG: L-serine ammonia-lyase [Bacteroidota bacterium]
MEVLSIFDIFKIGVGPSSSHTLGPWKAALHFVNAIEERMYDRVKVDLYGSLSSTGRGHCTDIAVQLGLAGYEPESIDTRQIDTIIGEIQQALSMTIGRRMVVFNPLVDIVFQASTDPGHPNTLVFTAYTAGEVAHQQTYYSVGGGFIQLAGAGIEELGWASLPFPIDQAQQLRQYTQQEQCNISDIVRWNELAFRSKRAIKDGAALIFDTMLDCVYRGCTTEGILPGGLGVRRRAPRICAQLLGNYPFQNREEWMQQVEGCKRDFRTVHKWVSCFALAVNEENASLGRVVTSPTNGAAGVIPAVLLYAYFFCDVHSRVDLERFLLTSGEIGCIFKKGATISAAVGGCQAEIGVSSAMAAAGLTEILGGSPDQALMAAEIAMEHHLGLTCDPIGGLVQIPCIERNAMGAIKAITAADLALASKPEDAKVNLDVVVKTMWDTAQAMRREFKETSEGGLAINLPVIYPEC